MAHGSLAAGVVLVRGAGARDAVCRRPALQLPHSAHTRRYLVTHSLSPSVTHTALELFSYLSLKAVLLLFNI